MSLEDPEVSRALPNGEFQVVEQDLFIRSKEIIVHQQDGLITLRQSTDSDELPSTQK